MDRNSESSMNIKNIVGFLSIFIFFIIITGNASALTNVDSCQTLSSAGETYLLNASIEDSTSSTCFQFNADNITFDCSGFTINMTNTSSGSVVFSIGNTANSVIKNCIVYAQGHNNSVNVQTSGVSNLTYQNNSVYVDGISWHGNANDNIVNMIGNYFNQTCFDGGFEPSFSVSGVYINYDNNVLDANCNNTAHIGTNIFQQLNYSTITNSVFNIYGRAEEPLTFHGIHGNVIDNITINATNLQDASAGMVGRFCCGTDNIFRNSRMYLNWTFNIYAVNYVGNNITWDNIYMEATGNDLTMLIFDYDNVTIKNSVFKGMVQRTDGSHVNLYPNNITLNNLIMDNITSDRYISFNNAIAGDSWNLTNSYYDRGIVVANVSNTLSINSNYLNYSSGNNLQLDSASNYNNIWNNTFDTGNVADSGTGNIYCVVAVGNSYINGATYSGSDPTCGSCSCPLNSCHTLSTENETYTLNASIIDSISPCISFMANGTTLNCNGFYINETSAVPAISIGTPLHDVTIKNCNIYAMNCSGTATNPSQGIASNTYQNNLLIFNNTMHICGSGIQNGATGSNNVSVISNNFYLYNWTTLGTSGGFMQWRNISNLNYSNNYLQINTLSNGTVAGNAFEMGAYLENATFLNNRMDLYGTFNRGFHMGVVAPTLLSRNYYVDNLTIMCQNCSTNGVFAPNNITDAIITNVNIITDRGNGIVLASTYASNISMENITLHGNLGLNTGLIITATASGVSNVSMVNFNVSGFATGISILGNFVNIDRSVIFNNVGSGIISASNTNNTAITNSEIYNAYPPIFNAGIAGISVGGSNFNLTLSNLSLHDNWLNSSSVPFPVLRDLVFTPSNQNQCNSTFITNVNTTGNLPFLWYNYTVNIANWSGNFSDIILCNADNSVLNNLTSTITGSILYVFHSDNVTITNLFSDNSNNQRTFDTCNNAFAQNIFVNNSGSASALAFTNSNGTARNIYSYNTGRLFSCQTTSNCILTDSIAYNTNPFRISLVGTAQIGFNSRATLNNITSTISTEDILVTSASAGIPTEVNISNFVSIGAINNSVNMDNRFTNVTMNILNSVLGSKITERCSSLATNNCAMKNTLNLYNTTLLNGYNISTNSTMNVYWNLTVLNPQSANVIINDTNNVTVASFNDSESFWLLQYNVSAGNFTVLSNPYILQATLAPFPTLVDTINLASSIIYNVNFGSPPTPPIIDPSSITGNLILTIGFGIMGLMAVLTLLGFTYVTSEGKPDTNAFIKLFVAIVIIVIMIVAVWQGIVLPP